MLFFFEEKYTIINENISLNILELSENVILYEKYTIINENVRVNNFFFGGKIHHN